MKTDRFIRLMAAGALCMGIASANGSPLTTRLDDFHPNCDIRKLSLTREQHGELRIIRDDYKKALDNALKKSERSNRQRRREVVRILSDESFNQDAARNYVSARYLSSIDFAIDELQVYHRIYQLLTPAQRRQWLDACLK
ncbi:MAG: Spy/CpxP family protein refolding chaperone [Neisseria sp.]|nr:Spy/CpxP family protein refolding chaperone [Neisseria sp.]